jgi:hypothetical protein
MSAFDGRTLQLFRLWPMRHDRSYQSHKLGHVKGGKLLAKSGYLREIIDHYVRIIWMLDGKVLMIGLSFVERVKADNLSDNRLRKNLGLT